MKPLNMSTRTVKEEEDDSPPVISSPREKTVPSIPPSRIHTNHSLSSPLWFVLSVYGWAWFRLLYAIYSREMEDLQCTRRVCLDDMGLVLLMLSGLSFILAVFGLLRWSSLLLTPFLITQSVWTGGLAGGIIQQTYSEYYSGSRLVHVYAVCLLSLTVLGGTVIGIYLTLRSMDHISKTPIHKRKGRIELFAKSLFSEESENAPKEVRRDDSGMDNSRFALKTHPDLVALFEDCEPSEARPIFIAYG